MNKETRRRRNVAMNINRNTIGLNQIREGGGGGGDGGLIAGRVDDPLRLLSISIFMTFWVARSIVVEAAVHGCIHPGTKGAVMRGIKEEREGEKEGKKRRRAKRGRDNREEDEPLEKRGTTGEKMHGTSAPVTRCSFRWWPRNETVPTGIHAL